MSKNFLRGATFGALLASALTIFLTPKTGKKTREDAQKLAYLFTKKLTAERMNLSDAALLTREKYQEVVARTLDDYARGKKIAKVLLHDLSHILSGYWDEVRKELTAPVTLPKKIKKAPQKKTKKK